jgi:hypothetical protein
MRSLMRVKGLACTVAVTLALGIGANAAIFSVVRRCCSPARQSRRRSADLHPPERARPRRREHDVFGSGDRRLQARATTVSSFGDFSTINFTLVGLGEPRAVNAGVVSGSYFDVMGLRPVLGACSTRRTMDLKRKAWRC